MLPLPRRLAASSLALAALLAACQAVDTPDFLKPSENSGNRTEYFEAGGLEQLQPADVAILEVRNQTSREDVPLGELRVGLQQELVRRLYSPLDLGYVDATAASARAGDEGPDATLVVAITAWDAGRLATSGVLLAGAELRLFEGRAGEGRLLWGVAIDRVVDLDPRRTETVARIQDRLPQAIEAFCHEALTLLPERDPRAVVRR